MIGTRVDLAMLFPVENTTENSRNQQHLNLKPPPSTALKRLSFLRRGRRFYLGVFSKQRVSLHIILFFFVVSVNFWWEERGVKGRVEDEGDLENLNDDLKGNNETFIKGIRGW